MKHEFKIGDSLWRVPHTNTHRMPTTQKYGHKVTVTKVGRRWVYTDCFNERFEVDPDVEGLWVDGGEYTSPARIFKSQQDFIEHKRSESLLEMLTINLRQKRFIPCDNIIKAAKLLGVVKLDKLL